MEGTWSIGDAITNGFERFKDNVGLVVGAMVLVFFVNMLTSIPGGLVQGIGQGLMSEMDSDMQLVAALVIGAVRFVFGILGFLVQTYLQLGILQIFLKVVRGEGAAFGDLMVSGSVYLKGLIATFLTAIAVGIGIIFCIVPGIIVGLGLMFTQFIIVDQHDLGAIDAIKESWRLTDGHKVQLFLFGLAGWFITMLGFAACCVGVLATAPIVGLGLTTIYVSLVDDKSTSRPFG